ncbi:hypothetical protein C8R43DRAFT_1127387 [Mycena crocata]|nr:hypothetical protein C8R43DRAFT_1127387 [Mycena crocata]
MITSRHSFGYDLCDQEHQQSASHTALYIKQRLGSRVSFSASELAGFQARLTASHSVITTSFNFKPENSGRYLNLYPIWLVPNSTDYYGRTLKGSPLSLSHSNGEIIFAEKAETIFECFRSPLRFQKPKLSPNCTTKNSLATRSSSKLSSDLAGSGFIQCYKDGDYLQVLILNIAGQGRDYRRLVRNLFRLTPHILTKSQRSFKHDTRLCATTFISVLGCLRSLFNHLANAFTADSDCDSKMPPTPKLCLSNVSFTPTTLTQRPKLWSYVPRNPSGLTELPPPSQFQAPKRGVGRVVEMYDYSSSLFGSAQLVLASE